MEYVMLQFHRPDGRPTLQEALALFDLVASDVDERYGIVATDPEADLYVLLVRPQAVGRVRAVLAKRPRHPAEGLFGNPHVEPTGGAHS